MMETDKDFQRKLGEYKQQKQQRGILLDAKKIDEEARTVELAFSSETPVLRWFGEEILGHDEGEIDLTRLKNGAPLLINHDWDEHVGVVESVRIDSDRRGRAIVRFGKSARASEIFQDVVDGIRRHVSVGYQVHDMKLIEERENGTDVYRVTRWEPLEISIVSVPADTSVGVGRSIETTTKPKHEEVPMTDTNKTPQLDLNAEREAAREAERKRVAEIIEVGERFGAQDLAREVINSGGSVDELNRKILERGGHRAVKADSPEIGLTDKEVREFSVVRLLDALAHPQDRKAQERAAFEMEASRAAADKMKRDPRGALVPYDVLSRAMSVGSAADGGNLVATELMAESFVDLLRNVLAARQCGATLLTGLNGNVAIPRQTSGAAAFWLAEGGSSTESSATFDQVGLTPKTVGAHTEISRKLLKQSSIDIEQFVRRELAITLATAVDNAAINGTGASNEPIGIRNTTGIGSVVGGANGAAPTWDHIVDLETAVANANVIGDLCYLTNAKVRGALKKTAVDSGSGLFVWDRHSPEAPLNGYRAVVSNQVPSNLTKGTGTGLSSIICGNFSDLLIGLWGGLDIQVNPYSADTSGAVRITAFQDADVSVRHPESFAVMDDAIA